MAAGHGSWLVFRMLGYHMVFGRLQNQITGAIKQKPSLWSVPTYFDNKRNWIRTANRGEIEQGKLRK